MFFRKTFLCGLLFVLFGAENSLAVHPDVHVWSAAETKVLRSLWLGSLPPLPAGSSNAYADNQQALSLGRKLFSDARLSANGKVACATCHIPEKNFTDNLPVSHGMDDTTRRSMPLAGVAYSPWFFWDGRADSLWAQALGPIESPVEHGISRTKCVFIIRNHYKQEYEDIFGPVPKLSADYSELSRPAPDNPDIQSLWDAMLPQDRAAVTRLYANIGKSIAAFVRTIMPGVSRFDKYVKAIIAGDTENAAKFLTADEAVGLRLFIGKARCVNCHNGPLLTNNGFHNVGVPARPGFPPDTGRAAGITQVLANEFNCLGNYSDAGPEDCAELRFMDTITQNYIGAFKTPSLRNVADRPPYMHAGQFKTLREVLRFYQKEAVKRLSSGNGPGATDIEHGELTDDEISFLEDFLRALSGPISAALD